MPTEVALLNWEAIGAVAGVVALLGAAAGALLTRKRRIEDQAPRIVFSDVLLAPPGRHPRSAYAYALVVRLTNTGPGPAHHLIWQFTDEDDEWSAEVVHRDVLLPSASTEDWSGIRAATDQTVDPTHDEAQSFYQRCRARADCWDSQGKVYAFSPAGGGRVRSKTTSAELRQALARFPSRGEKERSLGLGDDGAEENKRPASG
jgi:hypothetical protein